LIRENIFSIFGEHDPEKRQAKIASLWAEDGVFIVPQGHYEGHAGIERAAAGFIETFPTFAFTERGEVQAYYGVGMIPWGFGPTGADPVITGIDVLVMKNDKISAVYVFEDSPKK
jgi:SnoaL-like domain